MLAPLARYFPDQLIFHFININRVALLHNVQNSLIFYVRKMN